MIRLPDQITYHDSAGGAATVRAYVGSPQTLAVVSEGRLGVTNQVRVIYRPGPELIQGDRIEHKGETFYVQGEPVTHFKGGKAHHVSAEVKQNV